MFSKRGELEGCEGQTTTCGNRIANIDLAGLQEKYLILDEYVLLRLDLDARACSPPPGYYSVYEEHLKSKICFPPHPLVIEVLRFWNIPLGQVHLLFTRHLVGFIIIFLVLGVPANYDLIQKYYDVWYGKGR